MRTLDLGMNGTQKFASQNDIEAFIREEMHSWQFVQQFQPNAYAPFRSGLKSLRSSLDASWSSDEAWAQAQKQAVELYGKYIHHRSTTGHFIKGLESSEAEVAAAAWAHLTNSGVEVRSPNGVIGLFRAVAFQTGHATTLGDAPKALDRLLADYRASWQSMASEIHSSLQSAADSRRSLSDFQATISAELQALSRDAAAKFEEAKRTQENQLRAASHDYDAAIQNAKDELARTIENHSLEMEGIRKAFEEQMALRSSVEYWKRKGMWHLIQSLSWGLIFVMSLVASAIKLSILLLDEQVRDKILPASVDWSTLPLSRIVVVGLLITSGVWLVRTIARLFFSNLHLYTDASERVVMVQTYLALLKENAAIGDNDRRHVMDALFRKASSGIMKSDAEPPQFTLLSKEA